MLSDAAQHQDYTGLLSIKCSLDAAKRNQGSLAGLVVNGPKSSHQLFSGPFAYSFRNLLVISQNKSEVFSAS
jgi:hypothetical protein